MNSRHVFQHLLDREAGLATRPGLFAPGFLAPTKPISVQRDGAWIPIGDSTASHPIRRRSPFHCVGAVVDVRASRTLLAVCAVILPADRTVVLIQDQAPPASYSDRDGIFHEHVFDFVVTMVDGARVAFAVQPNSYRKHSLSRDGPGTDSMISR